MSFGFGLSLPNASSTTGGLAGGPSLALNFVGTSSLDPRITFSRGSNATQFDSTGSLVYAPVNLLTYSEQFDNAYWGVTAGTVSVDVTTAPNGTVTADQLVETAGTGLLPRFPVIVSLTAGVFYVASVYAKEVPGSSKRYLQMYFNSGFASPNGANFDLNAGVVTSAQNGAIGSIVNVGNGWWRCSIATPVSTGAGGFRIALVDSPTQGIAVAWNPNGTGSMYFWGAQLNPTPMVGGVTASLSTYYPTVASAYYGPRLDYNPTTLASQGLLIEEQRTNSIRNNTMQGAVAGTPGTLPTNWTGATSFDGLNREVIGTGVSNGVSWIDLRISGTASTGGTQIFATFDGVTVVAAAQNQTFTPSVYLSVAAGSSSNVNSLLIRHRYYNNVGSALTAQDTNVIGSLSSQLSRLAGTAYTATDATTAFTMFMLSADFVNGAAIDITLRIGLPQLEQGAFVTSVIPTTTAAATRSADVASVNTLSPWYNAVEGTMYTELQSLSTLTGLQSVALNKYPIAWKIDAGASDTQIFWYGVNAEMYVGGTYNNIGSVPVGINKIAVALASSGGQSSSSLNGAAAVNRSGSLTTTATAFTLGRDESANVNNFLNGYIRRISYYPRRLSSAELQAITS